LCELSFVLKVEGGASDFKKIYARKKKKKKKKKKGSAFLKIPHS